MRPLTTLFLISAAAFAFYGAHEPYEAERILRQLASTLATMIRAGW